MIACVAQHVRFRSWQACGMKNVPTVQCDSTIAGLIDSRWSTSVSELDQFGPSCSDSSIQILAKSHDEMSFISTKGRG